MNPTRELASSNSLIRSRSVLKHSNDLNETKTPSVDLCTSLLVSVNDSDRNPQPYSKSMLATILGCDQAKCPPGPVGVSFIQQKYAAQAVTEADN